MRVLCFHIQDVPERSVPQRATLAGCRQDGGAESYRDSHPNLGVAQAPSGAS
jgi:hypothetical protein